PQWTIFVHCDCSRIYALKHTLQCVLKDPRAWVGSGVNTLAPRYRICLPAVTRVSRPLDLAVEAVILARFGDGKSLRTVAHCTLCSEARFAGGVPHDLFRSQMRRITFNLGTHRCRIAKAKRAVDAGSENRLDWTFEIPGSNRLNRASCCTKGAMGLGW